MRGSTTPLIGEKRPQWSYTRIAQILLACAVVGTVAFYGVSTHHEQVSLEENVAGGDANVDPKVQSVTMVEVMASSLKLKYEILQTNTDQQDLERFVKFEVSEVKADSSKATVCENYLKHDHQNGWCGFLVTGTSQTPCKFDPKTTYEVHVRFGAYSSKKNKFTQQGDSKAIEFTTPERYPTGQTSGCPDRANKLWGEPVCLIKQPVEDADMAEAFTHMREITQPWLNDRFKDFETALKASNSDSSGVYEGMNPVRVQHTMQALVDEKMACDYTEIGDIISGYFEFATAADMLEALTLIQGDWEGKGELHFVQARAVGFGEVDGDEKKCTWSIRLHVRDDSQFEYDSYIGMVEFFFQGWRSANKEEGWTALNVAYEVAKKTGEFGTMEDKAKEMCNLWEKALRKGINKKEKSIQQQIDGMQFSADANGNAASCPDGRPKTDIPSNCQEYADYYGASDITRGCMSTGEYNSKWNGGCKNKGIEPEKGRFYGCKGHKEWCWAVGDPHYRTFEAFGPVHFDYQSSSATAGESDKLMVQYGPYQVLDFNFKPSGRPSVATVRAINVTHFGRPIASFWCAGANTNQHCQWSEIDTDLAEAKPLTTTQQKTDVCGGTCHPSNSDKALVIKDVKNFAITLKSHNTCGGSWCGGGWIDMGIMFGGDWRKLRKNKGLCVTQTPTAPQVEPTCQKLLNCCNKYANLHDPFEDVVDNHISLWCMEDAADLCCTATDTAFTGTVRTEDPAEQTWSDCCDIFEPHCGIHGDAVCGADKPTCDKFSGQCI